MDLDLFTPAAHRSYRLAESLAISRGNPSLEISHLISALLEKDEGRVADVLGDVGIPLAPVRDVATEALDRLPQALGVTQLLIATSLDRAFTSAQSEANDQNEDLAGVDHLVLGLLIASPGHRVCRYIADCGVEIHHVRQAVVDRREESPGDSIKDRDDPANIEKQALRYGKDLVELARKCKLDPIIGRDDEIRRVVRILSRRTKNNPVLIGEPGVGKTAIVEGLAQRIASGDVPNGLRDKTIFSLDLGSLIAGAKYRGEFEERLKVVLAHVHDSRGDVFLFVDEVHNIVGAGASEGAMDAANMLKPFLSRGELHCIGATTLDEYRKHLEEDAALERRFQPVMVDAPSVDDSVAVLRGLRDRFESHHSVRIHDEALVAAVELADRYISDRFLPDKAIDLIDEAAAAVRTDFDGVPAELEELTRRLDRLDVEAEALRRAPSPRTVARLESIEEERAVLRKQVEIAREEWESDRQAVSEVLALREKLAETHREIERAEAASDLNRASELRFGKLYRLENELAAAEKLLSASEQTVALLQQEVHADHVADVVARWTGVPVRRLVESEREKILHLADDLSRRVVGQTEAVTAVVDAILRSRSGLLDANHPVGSFLFLGPTGVGKTELAKAIAGSLFASDTNLVRLDMSEYTEPHSVARLIGAPPGYVGYDHGGQLTEAVRRQPYSVVLLDEVEKAHPEIFNVLLSILDEGRLTDGRGRTVDFRNTIVVMTSNIASPLLEEGLASDGRIDATVRRNVNQSLSDNFRPEFLNRLDEVVLFAPLGLEDVARLVEMEFESLARRMEAHRLHLEVASSAVDEVLRSAYNPVFGARPIKRFLQKTVETELGRLLVQNKVPAGATVHVCGTDGGLKFDVVGTGVSA